MGGWGVGSVGDGQVGDDPIKLARFHAIQTASDALTKGRAEYDKSIENQAPAQHARARMRTRTRTRARSRARANPATGTIDVVTKAALLAALAAKTNPALSVGWPTVRGA